MIQLELPLCDREIWIDIEGYDGYQISNLGRVKSLDREIQHGRGFTCKYLGRVLKQGLNTKGYPQVSIFKKSFPIHRLVLPVFNPCNDRDMQVNHIDGDKTNNRLDNLEWVTASENMRHSYKEGLACNKGDRSPARKLSSKDVLYIRREFERQGARELSIKYKVRRTTIYNIVNRQTWSHLD